MRHKRILRFAEDHPDASLQEIADEIPTATVELIDTVLEKYGDPGGGSSDAPTENSQNSADDSPASELTDTQRETLEAIADRPEATQQELAETLDVTAATICNRVNSIPGFEWENRKAIVESIQDMDTTETMTDEHSEQQQERIDLLADDIARIERRLENGAASESTSAFDDPDLVHKVVHACMQADAISEAEELEIIKQLLD